MILTVSDEPDAAPEDRTSASSRADRRSATCDYIAETEKLLHDLGARYR